jgi:peptidoglycan hydrolase-like protein with peptidoglycan-binding domain
MRYSVVLGLCALLLTGCGSSTGDRTASGAGIGAGAGAVVGAVTGVSLVQGVVLGAAAGGLTGALTDESTVNLGDPLWAESNPSSASHQGLVREVQSGLQQLGYKPGPVDGVYGAQTKTAIRQYQTDHGLLTDGSVSAELAAHIQRNVDELG